MMGRGREYFHAFRIIAEGFQPLQQKGRFCGASVGSSGGVRQIECVRCPCQGEIRIKLFFLYQLHQVVSKIDAGGFQKDLFSVSVKNPESSIF